MDGKTSRTATGKISDDVVEYVNMRIASAKLAVVESLSKFVGNAIRILIFVLFCMLTFMALSMALIVWLGEVIGSLPLACLIVGLVCLVLAIVVHAMKKTFINPMVRMFSGMIFRNRKKDGHED